MFRLLGIALVTIAVAAPRPVAGQALAGPNRQTEAVVRTYYRNLAAARSDSVLDVITRDFKLVGGGMTMDREGMRRMLLRMKRGQTHELSGFRTVVKGDSAEVRYLRIVRARGTSHPYEERMTMRRVAGRWLIARLEATQ